VKIFIGFTEIANVVNNYSKGFRALGHDVSTVLGEKNVYYPDNQYNFILDEWLHNAQCDANGLGRLPGFVLWRREMASQFLRALHSYDLFIFTFGTSFFPGFIDYPILRLCKKKIVCAFFGDDIRYWYAYRERMRMIDQPEYTEAEHADYYGSRKNFFDRQLAKVKIAERYSNLILSQPSMDQLQTRPYMRLNIPLDLSLFRFAVPNREVPVVLHAPTDTGIKGTKYIRAAVDELKREGVHFEFRLIENVSNSQLREMLTNADIVIDQVMSTTVATFAVESMATGNAVLAKYHPEISRVPGICPVINVTHLNIAERLREVIVNRELRRVLAYAGRTYVEKYHDHVHVAGQILDWLKPGGIQQYDFTPTFFKRQFVMPPELLLEERGKIRQEKRLNRERRRRKLRAAFGIAA